MIRFIREGDVISNGINIYHPSDRARSIGFKLRIGTRLWQVRYNPMIKKLFTGYTNTSNT